MPADELAPHSGTQSMLDRLQRDPEGGWAELVSRMDQKLRTLIHFRWAALGRVGCEPDDLLQEVFAEAARCLDRFEYRGPGSLQRWLAGILRQKLRRARRRGKRVALTESALARSTRRPLPHGLKEALVASRQGASWSARQHELELHVRSALESLAADEREVVLLKVYEGLTGREAARRARVDESTISVRYKRALAACARRLKELGS